MKHKAWFRKAFIYQVFVDRFFGCKQTENKPDFLGGNLSGITQKLDYLSQLGINAIWLSPFYKTDKYHGYHITDFWEVEPRFGNKTDLLKLIQTAHEKGIRIIADFVPNHCSVNHPFFIDAITNKQSKYRHWFIFEKWPDEYLCFLDYTELPKFNLKNKEVANYFVQTASYWLSLGIDGFRIDHIIGPPHTFWKDFSRSIYKKHPQAILFGEAWVHGIEKKHFKTIGIKKKFLRKAWGLTQEKIQLEYHNVIDGVLDFTLNEILIDAAIAGKNVLSDPTVQKKVRKHLSKVPSGYLMVTFLDNHDMDRYLRHCKGNVKALLNAFELLLSLNYPVIIYNGTENCLYNETSVSQSISHSDLHVRNPIDWNNINQNFITELNGLIKKYRKASCHS